MKDRLEYKSDFGVSVDPATLAKPVCNLLALACAVIAVAGFPLLKAIVMWLTVGPDQGSGREVMHFFVGMSFAWAALGAMGLVFAILSFTRRERWVWLAGLQIFVYAACLLLIMAFWFWMLFLTASSGR